MIFKRNDDRVMLRARVAEFCNSFNNILKGDGTGDGESMFDDRLVLSILNSLVFTCTSI